VKVDALHPCTDVLLVRPRIFSDERGSFRELFHHDHLRNLGVYLDTHQVNHSRSTRGVLRGLHFQHPRAQGKLIAVTSGRIFDVAVDVRVGSATFGLWSGHELTSDGGEQMYIPEGFAHGFLVLSDVADVVYTCSAPYDSESEHCLAWNDPGVGVTWPLDALDSSLDSSVDTSSGPILSVRDRAGLTLAELEAGGWLPRTAPIAP
jgi:dTDP-4-dehydrorhamnose 3,5-epimerase